MSPAFTRIARSTSRALLLLSAAACFASQSSFANGNTPREAQDAPTTRPGPVVVTEEVEVVAQKNAAPTDMTKETEVLLSVAGAATDPLQAIYSLPGITFSTSDGPGGSEPVIRGSAPRDNAYFMDLIPTSYIFHLFGNSIFDPHTISSFDLYPAAFSSRYGNATGGIIDVTLREPKSQDFTTTLHTSLLTAGFLVESGIGENQSFFATYRRSTMDLLLDAEDLDDDEGFRIDKLPISSDYLLKYVWHPNQNNRISVLAAGATDTLAATFEENHREALRDPDFAGPASLKQGFDSQGLTWNWQGKDRELSWSFSHLTEEEKLTYGENQHETTHTDRNLSQVYYWQDVGNRHSLSSGVRLEQAAYELDFNAKLVACSDLDPDCPSVDAEFVSYQDVLKSFAYEFHVEDRWIVSDNQVFTFGLHYGDDDYLEEGRLEPRLRYELQISNRLSTYLAAGQYSQLPQLRERIDVLGNPELGKIKADHYVWGISQTLGGSWRWNADLYFKSMKDVVISSGQEDTALNYIKCAEGRAYGAELMLRRDLANGFFGWATLSLSKSDRTNTTTGERVSFEYDKPLLFNLVGNKILGKFWTIGFKWSYQSGGRYTPIVGLVPSSSAPTVLEPVYGPLNSEKLPDTHRLDLRVEYLRPKKWGHWKLYADILNAYDHKNISTYQYAPDGRKLIPPPPGYGPNVPVTEEVADRIFPSIGFEVKF